MEEPTRVAVWCFCFDSDSGGSFSFFFPDFLGNLAYVKSNGCSWLGFIGLTSFLLVRMLPFTQALLWGLQDFILGLWPFQPLVFLLRAQVYDSEGRLLPFYVVHSIRKILNFDFRVVLISLTLHTRGLGSPSRAQHLSSLGFSCRRPFLVRKKVQPNHPFLIVEGFPWRDDGSLSPIVSKFFLFIGFSLLVSKPSFLGFGVCTCDAMVIICQNKYNFCR